ncbi:MAG: signal peptidase I [Holosporales bacterium]|jgi:signal peptidase I
MTTADILLYVGIALGVYLLIGHPSRRRVRGTIVETIKTIVYAGLLALTFRTIAFEPFNIPSESMLPGLVIGDYLFVSKPSYGYGTYSAPLPIPALKDRLWFTPPQRGDVVVFRPPHMPDVAFIKRLIGLPGDRVQVLGGALYLNGAMVSRTPTTPYIHPRRPGGEPESLPTFIETLPNGVNYTIVELDSTQGDLDNTREFTVPEGHYFFMGDNRDRSDDSRASVGMVPKANLIGRAETLFFSLKPEASIFAPWEWPAQIRYERLLQHVR